MDGGGLNGGRVWARVKWSRAGQLAPLLDGSVSLDGITDIAPAKAFATLRETDGACATRFVAQCLPRMDAVRWLAACLQQCGEPERPTLADARTLVLRWARDPSDKVRRLCFEAGQRAGFGSAEGAACLAIFLSGGSMAPAEQEQLVNPPAGAFGQAVAGAVLMAALRQGPQHFETRLTVLLDLADAAAAGEPIQLAPEPAE